MPRVKLLTSNVYSPTNPSSEAAIREQIDGSIAEVYDAFTATTGSAIVGHDSPNIAATNTKDAIEEVYAAIASTVLGEIPDNSIPNLKLGTDIKVGSLSDLTTTEKSSVVSAINEIDAYVNGVPEQVDTIETNLAILKKYNPTTGSNVALAVDTAGTFDLTLEGNILNITPNVTNTGAMTINADAQGAKSIKKFNIDTDAYVDVEAGDIPKNTPVSLSRSVSNDFFVYAPKGGSNIKSIQSGFWAPEYDTSTIDISISPIDINKSICEVKQYTSYTAGKTAVSCELINSTTLRLSRNTNTQDLSTVPIVWNVIEFNNVKSKQTGVVTFPTTLEKSVSVSPVNPLKSMIFTSYTSTSTSDRIAFNSSYSRIIDASTIGLRADIATTMKYQLLEFK